MKKLLENSRYIVYFAVVSSLIASLATFVWATVRMLTTLYHMFLEMGGEGANFATTHLVGILDAFILAVIFYIFSVALHELFIGDLDLPNWLEIRTLDDLKKKVSSVIALMLAVTFLEHITQWVDPLGTLYFGIAIAVVIFALIFYMKEKDK
ncbi:MAG: YqhA family protein [bacterium]